MKSSVLYVLLAGLWLLAGCVEPYLPETAQQGVNALVVDGFINTSGVTRIRLTRSASLDAKALPVEARASVFIEQEGGARYPLTESPAGTYTSAALQLSPDRRVRLYIKTTGLREYASDFVAVKITPPIDSVTWRARGTDLDVFVSTHDATDQARYYRWEFEETWEFTSAHQSFYEYRNHQMYLRTNNIYRCWSTQLSTAIKLGNTARLAHDVLLEAPVMRLPSTSEKLRWQYSVLVKQYAQTAPEQDYWRELSKNTDGLGTVFGPTPTLGLTGNVHCLSNADETVLGYVGAQSVTEKRLFIDHTELPRSWYPVDPYADCTEVLTIPGERGRPTVDEHFSGGEYIPINEAGGPNTYTSASKECVDCRLRGSNVKPSFWP